MNTGFPGNSSGTGSIKGISPAELAALEHYIETIWKYLPVPVICVSPNGVILDASDSVLDLLRCRRDELVGETMAGLFADSDTIEGIQRATLQQSRVNGTECVIRDRDGQSIPVVVSTLCRKDERGRRCGYFAALSVMDRRAASDAFAETQYGATLNSLGDGIHVVGPDLRITMVNDALRTRIWDLDFDIEPVGRTIREVFGFLPPSIESEYAAVFEKGELLVTEERVNVGGREFVSEVRKIPIFEADKVRQVVTVIHDVTQQKRDERIKTVLCRISSEMNTARDLDDLCGTIQELLGKIMDARNLFIALRSRQEGSIAIAYSAGGKDALEKLPPGRTLTSYIAESDRPLLITREDARRLKESGKIDTVETPAKVWLGVPLRFKEDSIGALVIQNIEDPFAYKRKDLEILEFVSERIAEVIERKRVDDEVRQHIQRLKRTSTSIIFTMAKILELRDPYTAGHQQRVARLGCAIAREMGLGDEEVDGIFMAALVHDIGKIYVPAEILNRPAKLSETEMELVKTHPNIGYDIVKEIEFSQPVHRIVVQHHERMDGSGYPNGINGNDMILQARILAVADVVEAMASHRPYRPAFSIDETLNEIDKNREVLYDGRVVDACIKVFRQRDFRFD